MASGTRRSALGSRSNGIGFDSKPRGCAPPVASSSGKVTGRGLLRPVPVAAPLPSSTWEEELWRVERLYGSGDHADDFTVEDNGADGQILRLVLDCTDPDWEAVNWAPGGLRLELLVPAGYPEQPLEKASLRVLGAATALPPRFVELLPLLFFEAVERAPPRTPCVYRAFQHVDRHMTRLWLKVREKELAAEPAPQPESPKAEAEEDEEAQPVAAPSRPARDAPWSSEDQAVLEAALLEFRNEPDVKRRWYLIGQRVGRSGRDCAERFKACKQIVQNQAQSQDKAVQGQQETPALGLNATEIKRAGIEVRLVGLCLEGIGTLVPQVLRLQVVCGRCKKPGDMEVHCNGTQPACQEVPCGTCKLVLALRVAPSICHGGCPAVAHVLGDGCHPTQLLRSDFQGTCAECAQDNHIRQVAAGYRKRAECSACFKKMNLTVEGSELLGQAVAHWREVAQSEGERVTARRQLQEARRHERDLGIKVGQPLPLKGGCKHFSKSYRWLRFPCCGRAFPCGICHDEQMDHPHEWANRMLCGHCSQEQPYTKETCAHCGVAQTRSRTAHWEGGEGMRNKVTMARNDPHKYKGLGKATTSLRAPASKK